jgi:hypothetical protein
MSERSDLGRIAHIRLRAYGETADVCSRVMHDHAVLIEEMLGVYVTRGEEVIERSLAEPSGSLFAYEGRLTLHPDIQDEAKQVWQQAQEEGTEPSAVQTQGATRISRQDIIS